MNKIQNLEAENKQQVSKERTGQLQKTYGDLKLIDAQVIAQDALYAKPLITAITPASR